MPLDWTNKHADISSDCPQDLCFDKLIKQCLSCHLYGTSNADTRDLTSMAPTPTQLPPHPSGNMPSPVLVFGIPVLMGLVLVLASVWGFITWKMRRRRRKREKPNKESKDLVEVVVIYGRKQISEVMKLLYMLTECPPFCSFTYTPKIRTALFPLKARPVQDQSIQKKMILFWPCAHT